MARLLFRVVDAYFIRNRGLLVIPDALPPEEIRRGDSLHFRRPDGSQIITTVAGVEVLMDAIKHPVAFLLPQGVGQEEVPVNTEAWSAD